MSMNLTVYVGPYLEVHNCHDDLIYEYESLVQDGRGELGVNEKLKIVIPNRHVPGIVRQLQFGRFDDMTVVDLSFVSINEKWLFENFAKPFTDDLARLGGRFYVLWGVVCGMS